ncbi:MULTISPECIES: 4a-hydroxytetrahydrobiopterin dehydratase [Kitasatospora]|uniref:Putative pterin-4-alpha-carbinolamine dehydratase n=1 Tax=Kitasatospora griseola TaxID=2064 RepID=A0A0D0NZD1_KITGR|nr:MULTISPECIES: 4a-hydroxytetrahydrobiopterin dehydratase [Kitasatospora]KIQ64576.1 pterin-4-alpha-carbinolamine dehydratase [Kitasatospora griseola]PJN21983.1 4a-hydroxytetrahydrobiopterin dehydratase [Kitasatospora sp. CB02891]GGQ74127.1 4a-hydroxytetrahydrobiopterin dehydratase [Kitasatospora griseola]
MSRTRLTEDQITAALADLPHWTRTGEALTRTAETASFPTAIKVVDAVAEQAEALDHHPDIDIRWRTLTFVLSTHSAGGLTGLDFTLAHLIDQALDTAS